MSSIVRIVGDVHGLTSKYVPIVENCKYSIQLGDMSFNYDDLALLDPNRHKFFAGNHDNYDIYNDCPHSLGDFGRRSLGPLDFFFIRGEFSIDAKDRLRNYNNCGVISWWQKEQLNRNEMEAAYNAYTEAKPKIMITHGCPQSISLKIGNPGILKLFGHNPDTFTTSTQELLQCCLDYHSPDIWIFGHYHLDLDFEQHGTRWICLKELCYIDYIDGKFVKP